jgi:hypothetical protein
MANFSAAIIENSVSMALSSFVRVWRRMWRTSSLKQISLRWPAIFSAMAASTIKKLRL